MKPPLVVDSVFVRDFGKLCLLWPFLGLGYETKTTSTACYGIAFPEECTTTDSPSISKVYIETLSGEELDRAFVLGVTFEGLAFADYTILYMAKRDGLELITCDSCIRKVASSMNIVVHDYLWVMCEMVKANTIDLSTAICKYNELETSVNRLAVSENPVVVLQNAFLLSQRA